jgi:hypothetical protein
MLKRILFGIVIIINGLNMGFIGPTLISAKNSFMVIGGILWCSVWLSLMVFMAITENKKYD